MAPEVWMSDADDRELLASEPSLALEALTQVLRGLVQTKSINPDIGEAAMTAQVMSTLRDVECESAVIESLPNRHSIAALIRCRNGGPRLVLNGHMDTVGIDERSAWSHDPFAGEVDDGFLYGRGACDMKAGLTAMLAVGRFVASRRQKLSGELVLHFAIGEERGEPGTRSLLEAGYGGDFGIVTEPSNLNVAVAQRGLAFFDITIAGRSAHASRPDIGSNPILLVPQVLELLANYEQEARHRTHKVLPSGTCTPTMIHAGVQPNSLSDHCQITVDRRLLPGETPEGELRSLQERLRALPGVEISLRSHNFRPAEVADDCFVASELVRATELVTGRPAQIQGAPYATDCSVLVHDGRMEAVVFGPGDPTECHCPDERVSLSELRDASLVLARLTLKVLS
jgi:succinyl-diaminopimelate desuccinylase